ncbi:MAG: hypothetical protein CL579_06195 [Alteromonadaceae bacterium]|nr:hypothetical protein [Alteromonadaceae bacterium]
MRACDAQNAKGEGQLLALNTLSGLIQLSMLYSLFDCPPPNALFTCPWLSDDHLPNRFHLSSS